MVGTRGGHARTCSSRVQQFVQAAPAQASTGRMASSAAEAVVHDAPVVAGNELSAESISSVPGADAHISSGNDALEAGVGAAGAAAVIEAWSLFVMFRNT